MAAASGPAPALGLGAAGPRCHQQHVAYFWCLKQRHMALSLASWGCGSELGERRDSHQLQRVPRERVREGSGLPPGGAWMERRGGPCHLRWRPQRVLGSLGSGEQCARSQRPGRRCTCPVPRGDRLASRALARVLRRCRPILFASELLRSLSILGWREHLAASPCGPRGCVCGVSGVIHQEWHALVRLLDASTAHLCRSAWISYVLSIVLPSVPP